jgi:hypothetical protein
MNQPHDAGTGNTSLSIYAKSSQPLGHVLGGLMLLESQLWIAMQMAPVGYYLLCE